MAILYSYAAGIGIKDGTKDGRTLAEREVLPMQAFLPAGGDAWMTVSVFEALGAAGLAGLGVLEFVEDTVPQDYEAGEPVDVIGAVHQRTYPDAALDPAKAASIADAAIKAQIAALEALLTTRLQLEADCGEDCTVNKPGCCIDGLSPVAARAQINTEIKALRAQFVNPAYYQVGDKE